jgi:phosphoribosyl-ATP pyrophosphohydrolase
MTKPPGEKKAAKAKRGTPKKTLRKPPKAVRKAEKRVLAPFDAGGADAAVLDALWETVEARRLAGDVATSHSARLLARGTPKVAQKLGEEAVECVIEATIGNRPATILESADLLYHLVVVWVDAGIRPEEVWAELARRQGISGVAEKASRPAGLMAAAGTAKLP